MNISPKIVVRTKVLEIACKLCQGSTVFQIAGRFNEISEEIHRNKHNYILRHFPDSSGNNSISKRIGGMKKYVLEKIIIYKLKIKENIQDFAKSVPISLEETETIIEDYVICKIRKKGYTLEELNKMLHLNFTENPRALISTLKLKTI